MGKKTKILIVDDEPSNLDFFDVMLTKLGFEVERAADGEEALEKVKATTPDLILLDTVMPRLSGFRVTRLLKTDDEYAAYREIPIIMFTAMDEVEDKIEGFELGVEDYILKPFNFSEVLARIRAVLRNHQLAKALLHKERRIALFETLNRSLSYFTRHLKGPFTSLLDRARELDQSDAAAVSQFVALVVKNSEESLAALKGLEDEISELESRSEPPGQTEINLADLEKKFQKHIATWKRQQMKLDEAHR